MEIDYGDGKTEYGTGIDIDLSGEELAIAIEAYLVAHDCHISGPRTIRVNGELCEEAHIYVDPLGFVVCGGERLSGRGIEEESEDE